jgi:hypothetical protein
MRAALLALGLIVLGGCGGQRNDETVRLRDGRVLRLVSVTGSDRSHAPIDASYAAAMASLPGIELSSWRAIPGARALEMRRCLSGDLPAAMAAMETSLHDGGWTAKPRGTQGASRGLRAEKGRLEALVVAAAGDFPNCDGPGQVAVGIALARKF